jgi:type III secretory pathway component EscV
MNIRIDSASVSMIFLLNFGVILRVWYFHFHFISACEKLEDFNMSNRKKKTNKQTNKKQTKKNKSKKNRTTKTEQKDKQRYTKHFTEN